VFQTLGMQSRLRCLIPIAFIIAAGIPGDSGIPLSNRHLTYQKPSSGPGPSITSTSLPVATSGRPYTAAIEATGGDAPLHWGIDSGSLPVGLALGSSTGVISGSPTITGTSSFTVRVTDANSQTATRALLLTVDSPPLPSS